MTQTKPSATSSLTGKWNPYPAYKDSGVEWVGQIPEHWEVKRLKFFAKVNMGQSPDSGDYNLDGIGIPFLQGNAEFGQIHPEPRLWCETARKFASVMDVLLSVRAPVGQMNISNQIYGIGRGLCAITVQRQMDRSYFWFFLQVIREELISVSTGSTYDAVSVDDVKRMTGFVPPLPEQRAIAIFLDREITKINALVAKKERMIELLQEKRAALISHAVTKGLDPTVPMKDSGVEWLGEIPVHWEARQFKRVAEISYGLTLELDRTETEGTFIISLPNVTKEGQLFLEDVPLTPLTLEEKKKLLLRKGDLLFNWRNGSPDHIGKTAYFNADGDYIYVSFLLRLRFNPTKYDSRYYQMFLNNLRNTEFFSSAKNRVNKTYNQTELGRLEVMVPPFAGQQLIASYLNHETAKIDALIAKIREGIEMSKEYSTALISAAVTGKVDVRGEITAPEEIGLQVGDEI